MLPNHNPQSEEYGSITSRFWAVRQEVFLVFLFYFVYAEAYNFWTWEQAQMANEQSRFVAAFGHLSAAALLTWIAWRSGDDMVMFGFKKLNLKQFLIQFLISTLVVMAPMVCVQKLTIHRMSELGFVPDYLTKAHWLSPGGEALTFAFLIATQLIFRGYFLARFTEILKSQILAIIVVALMSLGFIPMQIWEFALIWIVGGILLNVVYVKFPSHTGMILGVLAGNLLYRLLIPVL